MQNVKSILHNYQCSTTTINMTKSDKITWNKEKGKEEDKHGDKNQEKWAAFTYCGKEVNTALKY